MKLAFILAILPPISYYIVQSSYNRPYSSKFPVIFIPVSLYSTTPYIN